MKIAVTGATGFLGRYIVRHLHEQGHDVRAWFRPSSDRSGMDAGVEWVQGDLNDPRAVDPLIAGASAVVHAALHRPFTDPVALAQTNIIGSLRLIQSARDAGVGRFVFISSCAVHDLILGDRKLDEAHPLWPHSHYGAHKAAIEKFVHSYGLTPTNRWPICALRPTGIYGLAHPPARSKYFNLVRDVLEGKPITDGGGGKEVHAADVARAVGVLLVAEGEAIAGQAYNCYDHYVTPGDVARIARAITGSASPITGEAGRPRHQIETGKLRALGMSFGGKPLLEKTVGELVAAARAGG